MGLVDYSDSEGSDAETSPAVPKPAPSKQAFQKVIDRSEPKKIKVDLPSFKPEPGQQKEDEEKQRPAKRARTGGAFSGFNSMLPAPKGRVQSGPKPGVSLKTSSEAAFSRAPVGNGEGADSPGAPDSDARLNGEKGKEAEPKIVGKATKFRPLSVANKKKPAKKAKPLEESKANGMDKKPVQPTAAAAAAAPVVEAQNESPAVTKAPAPKPKKSLFSMQSTDDEAPEKTDGDKYEALTSDTPSHLEPEPTQPQPSQPNHVSADPNSLQSLASDLNLTPAQRRQLFGRDGKKNADANIARFNMDSEYAANEQARQSGEVVEHRAVKSIAPGKHSLQQLVNNARTQQGGLEDKWAEGRRERGEAGGKYGWGK